MLLLMLLLQTRPCPTWKDRCFMYNLVLHGLLFLHGPLMQGLLVLIKHFLSIGHFLCLKTCCSSARSCCCDSLTACAKLVSPVSPAWDVDAGRAKRFAQFRRAKVSHFARHTDHCDEVQTQPLLSC